MMAVKKKKIGVLLPDSTSKKYLTNMATQIQCNVPPHVKSTRATDSNCPSLALYMTFRMTSYAFSTPKQVGFAVQNCR